MKYYVYFLVSQTKKRSYVGFTIDYKKRLIEHNSGKNKSTKPYRPWKLIHFEEYADKHTAYKREWHLKHPRGYRERVEIIKKYGGVA